LHLSFNRHAFISENRTEASEELRTVWMLEDYFLIAMRLKEHPLTEDARTIGISYYFFGIFGPDNRIAFNL